MIPYSTTFKLCNLFFKSLIQATMIRYCMAYLPYLYYLAISRG